MSQIIDNSKIESPALQANASSKRRGDGSFDKDLATAEQQLKEKQKYQLFAPWAEAQKMFNIAPLEFKFDFSAERTEEKPKQEYRQAESVKPDKEQKETKAETKAEEVKVAYATISKQVLKKNLSTPQIQVPVTVADIAINRPGYAKPTTKIDLKMVIDEIVQKTELIKTGKKAELNLSLYQENLGDLTVLLSLSNGRISIQIAALDSEAKKILEDNLFELESALKNARISLKDLKVTEANDGNYPESRG